MINLDQLFQSAATVLAQDQATFNQSDPFNANHGDHMLQIFQVASQAARQKAGAGLAEAMEYASQALAEQSGNGSAQVYAHGLAQMAQQFRNYTVTLDDLVVYVQGVMKEERPDSSQEAQPKSADVLKALLAGLSGWQRVESGQSLTEGRLDIGYLFELGIAYMQAKQRGGTRLEVLADAAASASPLSNVPHRYQSGKVALLALLQAMSTASS